MTVPIVERESDGGRDAEGVGEKTPVVPSKPVKVWLLLAGRKQPWELQG
jgi:hypothetical protein